MVLGLQFTIHVGWCSMTLTNLVKLDHIKASPSCEFSNDEVLVSGLKWEILTACMT